MNGKLRFIITLSVVLFIALRMLNVFSSSSAANNAGATSRSYIDVTGMEVSLSDFHGSYLWVDYAAEWCSYCEPQTRTLQGLEEKYGDKLTFVTVVTGTNTVMEPPTAQTAMNWARRFDLDTDRVLACFRTNRLPYHILYAPSGEILFQDSGLYNAGRITDVLHTRTSLFD